MAQTEEFDPPFLEHEDALLQKAVLQNSLSDGSRKWREVLEFGLSEHPTWQPGRNSTHVYLRWARLLQEQRLPDATTDANSPSENHSVFDNIFLPRRVTRKEKTETARRQVHPLNKNLCLKRVSCGFYVVESVGNGEDSDRARKEKKQNKKDRDDTKKKRKKPEQYIIEKIIDAVVDRTGKTYYNVVWTGFPEDSSTWEPEENLDSELIRAFNEQRALAKEIDRQRRVEEECVERSLRKDGYYEVESLQDRRIDRNRVEYFVKWKGFDDGESSWVPLHDLIGAAGSFVEEYEKRVTVDLEASGDPASDENATESDMDASDDVYEIEYLVAERYNPAYGEKEYLVHWVGYGEEDRTWEPATSVECYSALIDNFRKR